MHINQNGDFLDACLFVTYCFLLSLLSAVTRRHSLQSLAILYPGTSHRHTAGTGLARRGDLLKVIKNRYL